MPLHSCRPARSDPNGIRTHFDVFALSSNALGSENTAIGNQALFKNTTGNSNTATGAAALYNNNGGAENTANGANALHSNTTGDENIADGNYSLANNTTGLVNTATGHSALFSNTTGLANTATCGAALSSNTTGGYNTAIGNEALDENTTGSENIAIGQTAGLNLTTGDFNIDIGSQGVAGESSTIRIGFNQAATFIAGIYGKTTGSTTTLPVIVDENGQLGTAASSKRFKTEIKPMDKTSEAIIALKPVTFHYKNDTQGVPQFGLVAEDVAKVNPDLVVRDKNGEIYTVRYDAVNAMLLNEFLKEHKKTEKLEATVASLIATVKEQAAQVQKVSAQVEASKPARQVAENN